ncbi:MAG: PGF-CTERM sorting domain-containing protein [Halococcoides sp.]
MFRHRAILVVAGLLALVLLSGCAQVAITSEVAGDGTVDTYDVQIDTSASNYDRLVSTAESDGYDSLQAYLLRDVSDEAVESVDYDESLGDGRVTINVTLSELDPAGVDGLSVVESDGEIVYEDSTFVNEERVTDDASLTYRLEMPGEIVNASADRTDGSTAVWEREGSASLSDTRIRATSESPAFGVGPGPGPVVAVLALLAAVLIGRYRAERE